MNIVVATGNLGKIKEIKEIYSDWDVNFLSLKDVSLDNIEIIEDGSTFEENAIKKAKIISEHTSYPVMADDSGLCVDYLNGRPGIYSARYGEGVGRKKKLLKELEEVPAEKRSAHFFCSVCFIIDGKTYLADGKVEGFISEKEIGSNGFGYDAIFYYPEFRTTFGSVSSEKKDSISHRYNALRNLEAELIRKEILIKKNNKKCLTTIL